MADQTTYYYTGADGRRKELQLVEDAIAVAFTGPISERRLRELEAGTSRLNRLGQSPSLLQKNILVYRLQSGAHGPEWLSTFVDRLRASPEVAFVTKIFREPEGHLHLILLNEIIVRFRESVPDAWRQSFITAMGAELVRQNEYVPRQYLIRVPEGTSREILALANRFAEQDEVEWAAPNFLSEKRLEFQGRQWHLNNSGGNSNGGAQNEDARVYSAWTIGGQKGKPEIVIAIFDTGVDSTPPGSTTDAGHPGLQINIAPGGRDFDHTPADDDPNPEDFGDGPSAHGTACAGVAAGKGGLIDGAAPDCKILPIKMMNADDDSIHDAIHYAASRAQILSNSWSSGDSPATQAALQDVMASGRNGKGTIVLFAAGNQNRPINRGPKKTQGVIVVGSSNNKGARSGYSNYGDLSDDAAADKKRLNILAPSDGTSSDVNLWQGYLAADPSRGPFEHDGSSARIYTTDIRGELGYNRHNASDPANVPTEQIDYTGTFGGTSSACPLAAGICALVLSARPELTRAQVQYILEATADKIGTAQHREDAPDGVIPAGKEAHYNALTGYDEFTHTDGQRYSRYGYGRINAHRAVKAAMGDPVQQFVQQPGGAGAYQDEITLVLTRVPGTNQFVSDDEIELVDARRDREIAGPAGITRVHSAPGGYLEATYQPPGGAPAISDELNVGGQPA